MGARALRTLDDFVAEPGTVVAPPAPLPVLNEYRGHVNRAYAIGAAFTATDAHVLAASEDGRRCAWDLLGAGGKGADGMVRNVHGAHRRCVSDVACHPRGDAFSGEPACCAVSTGFDGALKVWSASEAAAQRAAAADRAVPKTRPLWERRSEAGSRNASSAGGQRAAAQDLVLPREAVRRNSVGRDE